MLDEGNFDKGISDVLKFWDLSGADWFAQDPNFDRVFRDRFAALHDRARQGDLAAWEATAEGCLALIILLDQYPRHAYRGTARMYATDDAARNVARRMIEPGFIADLPPRLRLFCLLPFAHSEAAADQALSVFLHRLYQPVGVTRALRHQSIIDRFGRFPHRNAILGRKPRRDENRFLNSGGFAG